MSINKKKETVKSRSLLQQTWHRLLKNKGAVIGMIFLIALVAVSFAAGYIYDYDNDIIAINVNNALQKPSMQHWFGTDNLGRDIFARILYGARYSLMIGVGAVSIGLVFGITLGAVAGFYGGMIDQIIMRIVDVFYSIPNIMIAVVIVSLLGTSTVNLLIALCFTCATSFTRIARAAVMTIRDQQYVEAAYELGLPTWKIIIKHILPNCLSPIIVQVTLLIGTTIIAASSLSFLGIGVPSPAPEWGAMLSEGRKYVRVAGYMCVTPGIAIMLTVLALNLLGDGLRDALDPKMKK